MRVIIGLLKGGIIGAGLGFGFLQLPALMEIGAMHYVLYGLIGALVGVVAGRPLWRQETLWTPAFKAVIGVALCIGIYALVVHAFGDPKLSFIAPDATASKVPYLLGAVVGVAYGIFVEVDDGGEADKAAKDGGEKQA